jgi:hypothetical protein
MQVWYDVDAVSPSRLMMNSKSSVVGFSLWLMFISIWMQFYLKINRSGSVTDLALLVAIGVNEQGFRNVLRVEAVGGERKEAIGIY